NQKELKLYSKRELALNLAFVPARFPEVEFMKVKDFIGLGRTPYLNAFGTKTEKDLEIIEHFIQLLDIQHLADKFTTELSDGERQLCAIAKALTQETPIILLDEPTAFLDYKNKQRIIDILEQLANELNLLILFSTHDLSSIAKQTIQKIGIEANTQSNE